MARRFKRVDYEQSHQQTVTVGECLPPDHLAYFIVAMGHSAFRQVVEAELGLKEQKHLVTGMSIFDDTAPWPSRRAFRPGILVIGLRTDGANITRGDYRFVLQGPLASGTADQVRQDEVVLAVNFTDELTNLLARARAAELLAREGVHKKVMTKLQKDAEDNFRGQYLALLLATGYAVQGGHHSPLKDIPASRPLNTLSDTLDHVKGMPM